MEAVSAYAVLREGVFVVAESDDVSREEGARGDALVVRMWSNCAQKPQTVPIPAAAFVQRGHVWSLLWNPLLTTLILGLMHGRRANAWA
eukprot:401372-Prymnesium_polylepis.1